MISIQSADKFRNQDEASETRLDSKQMNSNQGQEQNRHEANKAVEQVQLQHELAHLVKEHNKLFETEIHIQTQ